MKNLIFYIISISLVDLTACTGANDSGFDANRNIEHRSKTNPLPDFNSTYNDSTSIKLKPGNSPEPEPTEDNEEVKYDLKWI